MSRRWPLWIAIAALALGALLTYRSAVFSSRSGDAAPLYSTRRHDPYGTAALYTLLVERGIATRRLERPTLGPDDRGVLVQVMNAAPPGPFDGEGYHLQTRQLADWIAQGNTVVQLSRAPTELMEHFKIAAAKQPTAEVLRDLRDAEARGSDPDELLGVTYLARLAPDAGAAGRLSLCEPMSFGDQPGNGAWAVLARAAMDNDAIVAAALRVGRGRLIVVGAPTPALNDALAQEANLDFLLATIGAGPVLLDEWSHGIGHEATIVGFLLNAGLLPVLLQAAFVAGLYIWSTSRSHAPADATEPADSASDDGVGAGQIGTLGFLYGRSLDTAATAERVTAEVYRRLAEAMRCRPDAVRARLAALAPDVRQRCEQLLDRLAGATPTHDVHCPTCGYDLRGNVTGRCPECGAALVVELQRRVAQLPTTPERARPARRALRADGVFVDALNLSHELSQEIRRESRPAR
jgi:hypothetical protein